MSEPGSTLTLFIKSGFRDMSCDMSRRLREKRDFPDRLRLLSYSGSFPVSGNLPPCIRQEDAPGVSS